jgi:hypothetical protein
VIANAGHIAPVLVHPDGQAELLAHLPTGVGGVAFEPVEVKAADRDLLVLCTDVAQWLLNPGLTALCLARRLVRCTLADWSLSECGDVTELLVSELTTNAIRHASRPIGLRLMRTDSLLCEVSDDYHHLPTLRPATEPTRPAAG